MAAEIWILAAQLSSILQLQVAARRRILFGLGVLGRTCRGRDSSVRRIAFSPGRVTTPMPPVGTGNHLVSVNLVVGQVELKFAP